MWQGNSVNRDKTSQTEQQATHDPLVGRKRNENRECGELVVCCWSLSLMPSVKLVIEIVQKFKFCKTFDCVPVTKSKFLSQLGVQDFRSDESTVHLTEVI